MNDTSPATAAARRARGRPRKLSREAIVGASLALLDREGAASLTMRRVGSELGVEAMSLYRHVASRGALLDGVAERLASELEQADHGSDWAEALRGLAGGLRGLGRRHPAAFELVGLRVLATRGGLAPLERVLASLRSAGFTPARAVAAYRLVIAYARGYVLSEIAGFAVEPAAPEGLPVLRSLHRRLASEPSDVSFRVGLETILSGLRSEREGAP